MSPRSERQGRIGKDPGNECVCSLARLDSFAEYVQIFCPKAQKPLGGGRYFGLIFTGYVPLAYQNPYPIIVYSVAML